MIRSSFKYLCITALIVVCVTWNLPTIIFYISKTDTFKTRWSNQLGFEIQMQEDWYPLVGSISTILNSTQSNKFHWNKKNIIKPWTFIPHISIEKISCEKVNQLIPSFKEMEIPWALETEILIYGEKGFEQLLLPRKGILISNDGADLYKDIIRLQAQHVCEGMVNSS